MPRLHPIDTTSRENPFKRNGHRPHDNGGVAREEIPDTTEKAVMVVEIPIMDPWMTAAIIATAT